MKGFRSPAWLIILSFFFLSTNAIAAGVAWQSYSSKVFQQAAQSHRLVLIYGKTTWCPWCKRMTGTLQDPAIVKIINSRFVPVMIDVEKDADIANQLGIDSFPVLIIMNTKGKVMDRISGYEPPADLAPKLQ